MKNFKRGGAGLLFTGDVAFFMVALFVTLIVRYQDIPGGTLLSQHVGPFALMMIIWVVVFFVIGLYDRYILFTRKELVGTIIRAQLINTAIAVVFFFMLPLGITPKTNLAIYLVVSIVLISLWRLYLFPLLFAARPIHALIIGTGEESRQVRAVLEHNPFFQQVAVNYIDTAKYNNESLIEDALSAYVAEHPIDIIIADLNESLSQKLTPFFFNLTFLERRVTFFSLTDFFEQLHHRIPPSLIGESWLLQNVTADSPHYAYDVIKRVIDVTGAVFLLFPCAVIFPLVVIALKIQDGGAIFYRTTRVGQYNQPIQILKFRTMNGRDSGVEALKSKLYVTKFGMFMRKLRIDELPQLLNVLRGDLSFIGPRPEIPELAYVYAENIPYYNMRHFIKPGLSGWAQINNFDVPRQGVDVPRTIDKLSFDLYYLRHRSILLDMEIALKTVNAVLSRTGT
jgi:lipopolysaccharide/colanic/teichoic acid biosynthesis glycosyltransferase